MTDPVVPDMTPREYCLQLGATKAIADALAARVGDLRKEGHRYMRRGDNLVIDTPDGTILGEVGATKPKPSAKITDTAAFNAYMLARYPEKCVEVDVPLVDYGQIMKALRDHAPADVVDALIGTDTIPAPWAVNEIIKASEKAGEPMNIDRELDVPGVTVTTGQSTLQVRLEEGAVTNIVAMWHAGHVDPLRELNAA